jgi:hypothetical protein
MVNATKVKKMELREYHFSFGNRYFRWMAKKGFFKFGPPEPAMA